MENTTIKIPSAPSAPDTTFSTVDLQLAVILTLSGFRFSGTSRDGEQVSFIFHGDSEQIQKTIERFYAGALLLDPAQVFSTWKGLRTITYRSSVARAMEGR